MRWVFLALVVANVGLYLWGAGYHPSADGDGPIERPAVNEKSMLLLSERDAADAWPADKAGECVRIGPFESDDGFNRAAELLDEIGLSYNGQTVNARQLQAFRVLLGPFASAAELEEKLSALRAAGIDGYRIQGDDAAGSISLGLFSQRAAAESYAADLARRDVMAEVRAESRRLGPLRWLAVPRPEEPTLDRLRDADWGETQVRVQMSGCE